MGFEKFIRIKCKTVPTQKIPKIAIWANGTLAFNKQAIIKFDIKKYDYAVLYYDIKENRIGIKFSNEPTADGLLPITTLVTGSTIIRVTPFLTDFKIHHIKQKIYSIHKEAAFLIADLNKYEECKKRG